jgi:hypothetical protein
MLNRARVHMVIAVVTLLLALWMFMLASAVSGSDNIFAVILADLRLIAGLLFTVLGGRWLTDAWGHWNDDA